VNKIYRVACKNNLGDATWTNLSLITATSTTTSTPTRRPATKHSVIRRVCDELKFSFLRETNTVRISPLLPQKEKRNFLWKKTGVIYLFNRGFAPH